MGNDISTLDPFIIQNIAEFGWDIDLAVCRGACKRLRRAISVPERRTPDQLLEYGARYDSVPLCNLATLYKGRPSFNGKQVATLIGRYGSPKFEEWATTDQDFHIKSHGGLDILSAAAEAGRIEWCHMVLRDPTSVHYNTWPTYIAGIAKGGYLQLLEHLPPEAQKKFDDGIPETIMYWGARNGHKEICEFAKAWGCTSYHDMGTAAAEGNHPELMKLAMEWTSPNIHLISAMFSEALKFNNVEACITALELGGRMDPNHYNITSAGLNRQLIQVTKHYGALALYESLYIHQLCNQYDCHINLDPNVTEILLRKWTASYTHQKLKFTRRVVYFIDKCPKEDQIRLCFLAKSLGDLDYTVMRFTANNMIFKNLITGQVKEWSSDHPTKRPGDTLHEPLNTLKRQKI
jgi:hypothetical protein